MASVKVYNTKAKEVGKMEIKDEIFKQEYNEALIHQVVVAQLANKRQGSKSTLTRAEVRGGGIKPWRQKGTGRARHGSIRSPLWVGGGVTFAPKSRDFSKKINKQMRRQALKSALSAKVKSGDFIVVKEFKLKEAKTKEMAKVFENFKIEQRVLLVLDKDEKNVVLASRNIPKIKTISADCLNVYDVVANAKIMLTKAAVKEIEEANA